MNDTDARLWHPWLRVSRTLCAMLRALERRRGASPRRVPAGARAAGGGDSARRPNVCDPSRDASSSRHVACFRVTLLAQVERTCLVKLESGDEKNPSLEVLRRLAGALGVPVTELLE